MKIFANHAHVFRQDQRPDGTVSALLEVMDKTGIEKCVCFAPFYEWGLDYNPNLWMAEELKAHPELTGFGVVDIHGQDLTGQIKQIRELGFKGIKLHPAFQKFAIDRPEAFQVYAAAQESGLFLSFHTGVHWHRIQDYQPLLFDEVAWNFPDLKFSMEHVGGYCFFNEALAVILNNRAEESGKCNIYAGLTSVFDNDRNRFWYLGQEKVRTLLHMTSDELCLFGLDFPYNDAGKITAAIEEIMRLPIDEDAKQRILGGNLARVLGVDF